MYSRHAVAVLSAATAAPVVMASACGLLNGSHDFAGSAGGPAASGGTVKVEKPGLTIGTPVGRDDPAIALAQLTGIFASNGPAPVATVFRPGPSMYPALMNGSLDIGATDYVNFFGAVTKKTLTGKVVAEPYAATTSAVVLRTPPDSAIHSPADLSGRTIAGQAPGNICELLARALSRRNNPDPNSPKFVPIHFPDMPGARRAGQVDAAVEPEPSITEAERGVAVREPVSPITLAPTGMPLSGYVASDRFISADPEAVAAAQRSSELIDTVRHTLLPWAPKGGAV